MYFVVQPIFCIYCKSVGTKSEETFFNQLTNQHRCHGHILFSVSFSSYKLLKPTFSFHACVFLSSSETVKATTPVQADQDGTAPADVHSSWSPSLVSTNYRGNKGVTCLILCRRTLWRLKHNSTVFYCLRSIFSFQIIIIWRKNLLVSFTDTQVPFHCRTFWEFGTFAGWRLFFSSP